jgi:hypothetical protein
MQTANSEACLLGLCFAQRLVDLLAVIVPVDVIPTSSHIPGHFSPHARPCTAMEIGHILSGL